MEKAFQFTRYLGFYKTQIEDGENTIYYSDDHLNAVVINPSNWDSFKTKLNGYTSYLWSFIRGVNVDNIESVVEISTECKRKEDMVYCYHYVKFVYNKTEYEKEFSSHDIVKMCKRLNFKLPSHLSQAVWCKEIGIPHTQQIEQQIKTI